MTTNVIKKVSFQIIVDNHAHQKGQGAEHGLAVWIEVDDLKILFDTGKSDLLIENAECLGIHLEQTNMVILSHGHYDHTGGLGSLGKILPEKTNIYAHPSLMSCRYSRHKDGSIHDVGIPQGAINFMTERSDHVCWTENPTEIAEGIWVTGFIPRIFNLEDTGGDFWHDKQCTSQDKITDDMALWIESEEGLWIFSGCAHSGIINTANVIKKLSNRDDIHAIVGGTHLKNANKERLKKTADYIADVNPEIFIPCHCSGEIIKSMV